MYNHVIYYGGASFINIHDMSFSKKNEHIFIFSRSYRTSLTIGAGGWIHYYSCVEDVHSSEIYSYGL